MPESTRYIVRVPGCDDTTSVVVDLTPAELSTAKRIAELVTLHGGGCAPIMQIHVSEETTDDRYDLAFDGRTYNLGERVTLPYEHFHQ